MGGYLLTGFLLLSMTLGCSNTPAFTIRIKGIGFDCRLPQISRDTMRIIPIIMYMDVDIINNTGEKQTLGFYNPSFDQNNCKYGYFTWMDGQDTVRLNSNYSSPFEIEPQQSISIQLQYGGLELGDDPFLNKMSIAWTSKEQLSAENICRSDIEFLQRIIDSIKIGYISFGSNSFDHTDFRTCLSSELLFVDYNYSDDKAFEMRKSSSGWVLDFEYSD